MFYTSTDEAKQHAQQQRLPNTSRRETAFGRSIRANGITAADDSFKNDGVLHQYRSETHAHTGGVTSNPNERRNDSNDRQ